MTKSINTINTTSEKYIKNMNTHIKSKYESINSVYVELQPSEYEVTDISVDCFVNPWC